MGALFAAAIASAAALATADAEKPPTPSILLVTLDTVRADRIGAYGNALAGTPTLDRLAGNGVLFEAAISPTPVTLPSHTSLLTGTYPTANGVRDNGNFAVKPNAWLVSEVLRERGWRTGAFVGSFVLASQFGLDQGFEVYRQPTTRDVGTDAQAEHRADAVVADAQAWLQTVSPGESFFAWVHFYDPHAPYEPLEPWRSRFSPYDGEIAFCDAQLDRLLGFLDRRGLATNLLVAVVGDHGESRGDHGELSHGVFIYESTLRVPLIVSGPAVAASKGLRATLPVSTVALAATLLELVGVSRVAMPDSPLPPLLNADGSLADAAPPVYAESHMPYHSMRWHSLRGLRDGSMTLIEGRESELYDLDSDPGQQRNLAGARPRDLEAMRAELRRVIAANPPLDWADQVEPGAVDRRLLEALGYVVGDTAGDPFDPTLPDPREKIGEIAWIGEARDLISRSEEIAGELAATAWQRDERKKREHATLEKARALLERILAASPGNVVAIGMLGVAEKRLGDIEAAIRLFERFVSERPYEWSYRYRLATSYHAVGRGEDAYREVRRVLSEAPDLSIASEWMIRYHVAREEFGRAAWWLEEEFARLDESDPRYLGLSRRREPLAIEMRKRGQTITKPD